MRQDTENSSKYALRHLQALNKLTPKLKIYNKSEYAKLRRFISMSGKLLCLFYANYQCEKCGISYNLTVHHIVSRRYAAFMDEEKYLTQRNYFGNQIILCPICHCDIEQRKTSTWKEYGGKSISLSTIEKAKKLLEDDYSIPSGGQVWNYRQCCYSHSP